jgi:hypothetical protein
VKSRDPESSSDSEDEEKKEKEIKKEHITREDYRQDGTLKHVEKIEKFDEKEEEEIHEHHGDNEHEYGHRPEVDEVIRRRTITTIIDPPDHHHHHQDLAVVAPRYRDEDSIRREIRALEHERHSLKAERETVYESERDWEVDHRRRSRDVIRVERDRKGRMALVRSAR